ncbi:hypothetical protein RUM44_002841 [Polyplax serrata]|uniref:Small ribosomal subunit protein uS10m n=1 Tax=Polyplax serrata TaxID=468196 RepID=A0ABR1AFU9_POLSC
MPDNLYKSVQLEIKSCESAVMKSYTNFIKTAAQLLDITVQDVVSQKKPNKKRFTVLRSVHVHRKHLVQYEIRTHFTWIRLSKLTGSTADTFLEYVQRMLPEGVAMKVTRVLIEPMPSHLFPQNIRSAART